MNKTLQTLLCLCAAAVVFGSCQKDEPEAPVTTLSISIADSYTPNETNAKVVLNGITPKFEEGDQIWISGYPYTVNSDGTTVTGSEAETPYYAVFPYDEDMGEISGAFPTITLPTEQPYVSLKNDEHGNPIQKINAPMWAYAAAGEVGGLSFHNACALLRVRVRNNMGMGVFTLKSITVTSTTNDIAGTGTLAYNEETGEYDLTVSGSKTVTLTGLNEAVKENKSSQEYYIYIPSVADETFTIIANGTYSDKTLAEYTQTSLGAVSIEKSQIGKIALLLDSCDYFYIKPFSVSANKQVYFSPGNLQWSYSGDATSHVVSGGGTSIGTWRFAPNQYTSLRKKGANLVSEESAAGTSDWIDLFGWGTSGWNNGNEKYMPYSRTVVSGNNTQQQNKGYGYGPCYGSTYTYSLTGDYSKADWGVYNAIKNGDKTDPAGTWYTLTSGEWNYVYNERANNTILRTRARVCDVAGLILLPDNWTKPEGLGILLSMDAKDSTTNVINAVDWSLMEKNGAIFLPKSGYITTTNTTTSATNYSITSDVWGYYWASNVYSTNPKYQALNFYFSSYGASFSTTTAKNKNVRMAVRLVRNAQ